MVNRKTATWVLLLAGAIAACRDIDLRRGIGAPCNETSECREPYVCQLGVCRSECDVDRDCPNGSCLVVDEDTRVCTTNREVGCEPGTTEDCPSGFECGADGVCRNRCDSAHVCLADRVCSAGTCFSDPVEGAGGATAGRDGAGQGGASGSAGGQDEAGAPGEGGDANIGLGGTGGSGSGGKDASGSGGASGKAGTSGKGSGGSSGKGGTSSAGAGGAGATGGAGSGAGGAGGAGAAGAAGMGGASGSAGDGGVGGAAGSGGVDAGSGGGGAGGASGACAVGGPDTWSEDFSASSLAPEWAVWEYQGQRNNGLSSPANHISLTDSPGRLRYYVDPMTYYAASSDYVPFQGTPYMYDPGLELSRQIAGESWTVDVAVSWHVPLSVNSAGFIVAVHFGPPGTLGLECYLLRYSSSSSGAPADNNAFFGQCRIPGDSIVRIENAPIVVDILRYVRFTRDGLAVSVDISEDGSVWQNAVTDTLPDALRCATQEFQIQGEAWFSPNGSYADYDSVTFTRQDD
jgi:hypothetical protein